MNINKLFIISITLLTVLEVGLAFEEVNNCQELQQINQDLDENYVLQNDIECGERSNFEPLGVFGEEPGFTGNLDGASYEIRNLHINSDQAAVGLIGHLEDGAKIENLGVVDSDIKGGHQTGGIVGRIGQGSEVSSSYFEGEVSGEALVGGIAGWNWGDIEETYAKGSFEGEQVGGIAGRNFAFTISRSYAIGNISASGLAGGIAGENLGTSTKITETFFTGSIKGEEIGGILGHDNSYGYGGSSWDKEITGLETSARANGESSMGASTTEEMTGAASENLYGLDFDETWGLPSERKYPYLDSIQNEGFSSEKVKTNFAGDKALESNEYETTISVDDSESTKSWEDKLEVEENTAISPVYWSEGVQIKRIHDGSVEFEGIAEADKSSIDSGESKLLSDDYVIYACDVRPDEAVLAFEASNREVSEVCENEGSDRNELNEETLDAPESFDFEIHGQPPFDLGQNITGEVALSDKQIRENEYELNIEGPEDYRRQISINEKEFSFNPEKLGEYEIELKPAGTILSEFIDLLTGSDLSSQKSIRVTGDLEKWESYCLEKGHNIDSVQQKVACIEVDILPKYFEDHTGQNPEVAESLCRDLLNMGYDASVHRCA